tara:strand:+ start:1049 stop:2332 length:1284 start_codon:yes stop_codon:yes gene_type:complete
MGLIRLVVDIKSTKGQELEGKKIMLCITGSVASMESPRLARELIKHGADVIPVLSKSASDFIGPQLLEWATGNETIMKLTGKMEHITLANGGADSVDLILVAPCTSNTIGKIANGISDNLVTTICSVALGSDVPIVIVPGMHEPMYLNLLLQENIRKLKSNGLLFVDPNISENKAKMADPETILKIIIDQFYKHDLHNKKILITAGPTIEKIDPVRIITNNSSGKMGISIAKEAKKRGADVTLIYGQGTEIPPTFIKTIKINSTSDLLEVTERELSNTFYDFYVAAAAPSDFRVVHPSSNKIASRSAKLFHIELDKYPKVINSVKKISPNTKLIAFKALYSSSFSENEDHVLQTVNELFEESQADLVILNDVSNPNSGFASDYNEVFIYSDTENQIKNRSNPVSIPYNKKTNISKVLVDEFLKLTIR